MGTAGRAASSPRGDEAVMPHLERLGVPDFGLNIAESEVWTATLRRGVYRIEAGPAEVYSPTMTTGATTRTRAVSA
jgi:hypothetical protein